MSCTAPIPYETLVALWCGEIAPEPVEDHLFACDSCAASAEQLDRLIGTLHELVPPVLTPALRQRLAARGLAFHEMQFGPGERGRAVFAPEIDVMVFVLRAQLAGARRVDLEIRTAAGEIVMDLPLVPHDPERGEVLVACQQHYKAYTEMYGGDPEFRLYVVEGEERRQVASYVIEHVWP